MKDNLNKLIDAFLEMKTKEQMTNLLRGILTLKELDELTRRLQIVELLKKGVTQHQIADKLKVGVATVTRGSRELKMGRFKYI